MDAATTKLHDLLRGGVRTTEFWMALAAQLIGSAMAVGVIPVGSPWEKAAGLALMVLGAMGYTWSRHSVKLAGVEALAALANAGVALEEEEPEVPSDPE